MFSWTASSSPISLFTIFWTSPMGKKMFPYPASMRLTRHPHPRWPTARSGSRARAFSLTQAPNFWSAATARTGAGTSELAGLPPVPPPLPRASTSLPFPPLRDLLPRLERLPLGFRGSERGAPGLTWPHGVTPRALRRVCRFLRFPPLPSPRPAVLSAASSVSPFSHAVVSLRLFLSHLCVRGNRVTCHCLIAIILVLLTPRESLTPRAVLLCLTQVQVCLPSANCPGYSLHPGRPSQPELWLPVQETRRVSAHRVSGQGEARHRAPGSVFSLFSARRNHQHSKHWNRR